jgi:hypothetical protein
MSRNVTVFFDRLMLTYADRLTARHILGWVLSIPALENTIYTTNRYANANESSGVENETSN